MKIWSGTEALRVPVAPSLTHFRGNARQATHLGTSDHHALSVAFTRHIHVWSGFHGCSPTLFFECANCMGYPEIENKGLCNMKQPLFLLLHRTGYSTGLALISHPGVDRTCFQYVSHISDDLLKCRYYIYFRVTIVLRKVFGTCSCKHHSVNPTWRNPEIAVILLYQ